MQELQTTRHGCSLRLKLAGSPWTGQTGPDGVKLRKLLLDLVKLLQSQDLNFVANINFAGIIAW